MQQRREGGAASEGGSFGAVGNTKIRQLISTFLYLFPLDDEALFDEVDLLESGVLEVKQASGLLGTPNSKLRHVALSKVHLLFPTSAP